MSGAIMYGYEVSAEVTETGNLLGIEANEIEPAFRPIVLRVDVKAKAFMPVGFHSNALRPIPAISNAPVSCLAREGTAARGSPRKRRPSLVAVVRVCNSTRA